MKQTKAYLGLGSLLAGLFFLFDPFVSVFDLLPDFIGWLLIAHGLTALAALDGRISESVRGFRWMALLSGVRFLTIPFIFGLTAPTEQPVEMLLFTFSLAIFDLIVLIPAWRNLSGGFLTLTSTHEGSAALVSPSGKTRGARSRTERLLTLTLVFFICREVLAVLPEMTVLGNQLSGSEGLGLFGVFYNFIGILRLLCGGLSLVLGVIWLVSFLRFSLHVKKDQPFFDCLRKDWEALLAAHPDTLTKRTVKVALFLLGIGFALTTDFLADGWNVLPDALAALVMLAALLLLRRRARGRVPVMIGLCGFIPLSLLAFVRQGKILHELAEMGGEKFTLVDNASRMLRNPEDTARYFLMCAIVTAVQLLLVLLYAGLLRVLTNVIHRYTGLSVTGKDEERLNETHRMLFRRLLAAMILGAVSAVFSAVYAWTLPYAVGTFMEVFGMIDVILHAVFVLFYFRAASGISEEIEYRYLLS